MDNFEVSFDRDETGKLKEIQGGFYRFKLNVKTSDGVPLVTILGCRVDVGCSFIYMPATHFKGKFLNIVVLPSEWQPFVLELLRDIIHGATSHEVAIEEVSS